MNEVRNEILEKNHRMAFEHGKYVSQLKKEKQDLIKYLEDKNKEYDITANGMPASNDRDELITKARAYREILDKIKKGNYE